MKRYSARHTWLRRALLSTATATATVIAIGTGAFSTGCIGTTGGDLFDIEVLAAGAEDTTDGPYTFTNAEGFEVTLDEAQLFVGALYLNRSRPVSVNDDPSCFLSGIYVAEVTRGLTVDLLSPDPVPFPTPGHATSEPARTGEVWLAEGDVNDPTEIEEVLFARGAAKNETGTYPFEASITIGENRIDTPENPAAPGKSPVCKQRIVTPIPVDFALAPGGRLTLRASARALFDGVAFDGLTRVSESPPLYRFRDDDGDAPSRALYGALRQAVGTYSFTWQPE